MYHLIRLCARMGYHPREWRTSIAVALQKPKRDYSLPGSYRLIQLLEVLGKVLEWVQAQRLAYIAARHNLFPSSQLGEYLADWLKTHYYALYMTLKWPGTTNRKPLF